MIRKLPSGKYRLGTFPTRAAAERHERAVQFFKRRKRAVRRAFTKLRAAIRAASPAATS